MPKLDEQIKTLAGYFAADCEPDGKLTLQLEVEHFLTQSDGQPRPLPMCRLRLRDFAAADRRADHHRRRIFRLQRPGTDGHAGSPCASCASAGPVCVTCRTSWICTTASICSWGWRWLPTGARLDGGLPPDLPCRGPAPGAPHPGRSHGHLPAEKGACGVQMNSATAATQVSIDYQDETDFVRKMRAASLLTPFCGAQR